MGGETNTAVCEGTMTSNKTSVGQNERIEKLIKEKGGGRGKRDGGGKEYNESDR